MSRRTHFITIKEFIHKGMYTLKEPDVFNNTFNCVSDVADYKTCVFDFEQPIDYFEAQIVNNSGCCRIGFATKEVELLTVLGFDQYGYSYTSKNGYGMHQSRRIRFGERFSVKDFFSCYLKRKNCHTTLHFFINGMEVNKHFSIPENNQGKLFPALSLYNFCEVNMNFGPFFAYKEKVLSQIKNN
ncbi:hypothetical protein NUSPORA_00775 [Nucleospora cyclopteri]